MFQQTRIKLTLINSAVFIIFIALLGFVIYSFVENTLYRDINQSLIGVINSISSPQGTMPDEFPGKEDPRIAVVAWGENKNIIETLSDHRIVPGNLEGAYPANLNEIEEIEINGYYYRTIATEIEGIDNSYYYPLTPKEAESEFGTVIVVQALRNVNSEKEMLQTLLLILIIGCGISSLCAIGLGYFLAGRALVPIKKSWQKQQQFVSDASHELRTPLAVIQTKTDLLFKAPEAKVKEKALEISSISKEVRRLSKLVGNLLTLTRSDSDVLEVTKESFLLDKMVKEIVEHYSEFTVIQGKTLISKIDDTIYFVGDPEMIHQLLIILLDNAIKYTGEGGHIHLSCEEKNNQIVIKVEDSGIGIAEEDIPLIFDRFYQIDKSRTDESGVGLGLSIAKWIIDKHQGKVKVQSKVNEGTCFEVTFPKHQKG